MGIQRWVIPSFRQQAAVLCVASDRNGHNPQIGQHSRWQLNTSQILNNAIHWLHKPCSTPTWFDRLSKKPSVKANLAIHVYLYVSV